MICSGYFQKTFIRGWTRIEKGLTIGKRYDVVIFGVDNQGRLLKRLDFIYMPKPLGLLESDSRQVDPQKLEQRSGIGKSTFDNGANSLS